MDIQTFAAIATLVAGGVPFARWWRRQHEDARILWGVAIFVSGGAMLLALGAWDAAFQRAQAAAHAHIDADQAAAVASALSDARGDLSTPFVIGAGLTFCGIALQVIGRGGR